MNEVSKLKRLITFHLKREEKIVEKIKDLNSSEAMEVLTHIAKMIKKHPALKDWVATQNPEKLARVLQTLKEYPQKKK